MISAKTTRKMTLAGTAYAKGDPIQVPKAQFDELGPDGIGWLERETEKKAEPAKSPSAPKSD